MTQQIGGIASERLKSFVERIERLEEEKRALADDIKEVYSEAKGVGFDTKTIRQIVKLRRMDAAEREEYEALLDLYKAALGMLNGTPLGQAAVRRVTQKKPTDTPSGGDGGETEATAEPDLNVICDLTAGASPAVLRQLMEGIKRDLVVSKRMGISTDARSVFERLLVSIRPHEDLATPPLWEDYALGHIEKLTWPPAWPEQKAA